MITGRFEARLAKSQLIWLSTVRKRVWTCLKIFKKKVDLFHEFIIFSFDWPRFRLETYWFWRFSVKALGSSILSISSYINCSFDIEGCFDGAKEFIWLWCAANASLYWLGVPTRAIFLRLRACGTGFEFFFSRCIVLPLRSTKSYSRAVTYLKRTGWLRASHTIHPWLRSSVSPLLS